MAMKNKPNFKGILEGLSNIDIPFLKTFADIAGNHWLGVKTPETVNVTWEFHRINTSNLFEFKRFEEDSTGVGMDQDTLEKEFFSVPPKAFQADKFGVSVHGLGEKVGYAKLTKDCKEYRSTDGITVLTKTKDSDKYLHAIFNMYDYDNKSHGYIQQVIELTKEEAISRGLPVERIGECGTYSRYIISLPNKDWYEKTKNYIGNIFMGYLSTKKMTMNFKLFQGGLQVDDSDINAKRIPYDTGPTYAEPAFRGELNYEGRRFSYDIGRRPMNKSSEFIEFNKMYPGEQALLGEHLTEPIAKNMALLVVDRNTGYIYGVNKIAVTEKNLHRLVIRVYVTLDDIETDTVKARCYFKKSTGKSLDVAETHRAVLIAARRHYQKVNVHEDELREQLMKILHGELKIRPGDYTELCKTLDIPVGDYEWARKNIVSNTPVLHKKLDIYIKSRGHIIEIKKTTPKGDEDFNQIICYATLAPNTQRVTTLAVSNETGEYPTSINDMFTMDAKSKFVNDLNTHETTKHISWNLVDLRYFELHKLK